MPTKKVGLRRVIQNKFSVVLVDEFRTSKLYSHCDCKLEHYNNLHRVLVYRGCKSGGSRNQKYYIYEPRYERLYEYATYIQKLDTIKNATRTIL